MSETNEIIEAQTVPPQALAKREDSGLATISSLEQSFALAVRQRELLSDYIKKQLVPGKHFYQRGDQKPSLSKEGAEIILLPHNLAPDYELVSGPEMPPEGDQPYQITVKCILRRKGDPQSFVGSGMGSAGSHHRNRDGKYLSRQPDRYLCHNATLKMAQKSAMIAATINSTAASEFFTQDVGEPENGHTTTPPPTGRMPRGAIPPQKPVANPVEQPLKGATEKTKEWFLNSFEPEEREMATQFCMELGWIMPNEGMNDLPLRFIPVSKQQLASFRECLGTWIRDGKIGNPYLPNKFGDDAPEVPQQQSDSEEDASNEPWFGVIVPIPRRGMKRDEYLKSPDTIGSLFSARHDDEEARKRLFGFAHNFEPKPWTGKDGKERPPSKTDVEFRGWLDQFMDYYEHHHPEEKL